MPTWLAARALRKIFFRGISRRSYSTAYAETVSVPCASSGSITVDLFNLSKSSTTDPLVVYIPPSSGPAPAALPGFLRRYPTAIINYRWPTEPLAEKSQLPSHSTAEDTGDFSPPLHWPTPIHDMLFGYSWITANLSPPGNGRRHVYVYGSYLGAGLAAALALTESHTHQRMAVRGLVAYNGIYNWTMFLPDHPIHKSKRSATLGDLQPQQPDTGGRDFDHLKEQMPMLFRSPSDLFDPFASPCLFFHTAGMLVPPFFSNSSLPSALARAIDELSLNPVGPEIVNAASPSKPPRKGYLAFPPRQSTLKIPECLLLYESPPPFVASPAGRRRRQATARSGRARTWQNNFQVQAVGLASVMRRSIEKLELKERMKWDDEFEDWEEEAARRVRVADIGEAGGQGFELSRKGYELADRWLEEVISRQL